MLKEYSFFSFMKQIVFSYWDEKFHQIKKPYRKDIAFCLY